MNSQVSNLYPQLPRELILLIVQELQSDTESLKSSSLVCRAWCHPSQRILHSRISLLHGLRTEDFYTRCLVWLYRLEESPHIAPFITELELNLGLIPLGTGGHVDQPVRRFVGKLVNLHTLHLMYYKSMYEEFLLLFKNTVRTVHLMDPRNGWQNLILSMPDITSLCIRSPHGSVTVVQGEGPEEHNTHNIAKDLKRLELACSKDAHNQSRELFSFLLSPSLDFSNLCFLKLEWISIVGPIVAPAQGTQPDVLLLESFFEKVGTVLEVLVLVFPSNPSQYHPAWNSTSPYLSAVISQRVLAHLKRLKRFSIELPHFFPVDLVRTWKMLRTIPTFHLEEFTLLISFHPQYVDMQSLSRLPEWKKLDKWLSNQKILPRLRRFKIARRVDPSLSFLSRNVGRELPALIGSQMTILNQRRVLVFETVQTLGSSKPMVAFVPPVVEKFPDISDINQIFDS
ncbi:hypothetical protein VKT23_013269 [Stygiomarasmius scandens]|uniref:F-box domain-containing protein n=1 Tax=Marasmiellus scandens TaxID=2682957 RepID=A0ABR1J4N4_9AGAR